MTLARTNLEEIKRLIEGKPASAAYSTKLPMQILKQISRDLRECEIAVQNNLKTSAFAAPLILIIHITLNNGSNIKNSSILNFDEETAYLLLNKFTYYIERELVGRIIGQTIDNSEEMVKQLRVAY